MKRIEYINPWYFALVFTFLYSSFLFYLFAELHPQGTPPNIESYFIFQGAGLTAQLCVYTCYRLLLQSRGRIASGVFFLLLFLLSLLLFPVFYGLYWGLLLRQAIYHAPATLAEVWRESKITAGSVQVPISIATILGLYNEKVFRLNQAILLKEKTVSETRLMQLQQQVDPHFLFNNLNILSALIRQSPEQAETFTQRLSELYRYYLRSGVQPIALLSEELAFMRDYLYLLEVRFGKAFRVVVNKEDDLKTDTYFLVVGTLQLLLENVVKHNAASVSDPMTIGLYVDTGYLVMENPLRPKAARSEGIGLKNLEYRYHLLTGKKISYGTEQDIFRIKIPLVKQLK